MLLQAGELGAAELVLLDEVEQHLSVDLGAPERALLDEEEQEQTSELGTPAARTASFRRTGSICPASYSLAHTRNRSEAQRIERIGHCRPRLRPGVTTSDSLASEHVLLSACLTG
jgi:hypothetical protein